MRFEFKVRPISPPGIVVPVAVELLLETIFLRKGGTGPAIFNEVRHQELSTEIHGESFIDPLINNSVNL